MLKLTIEAREVFDEDSETFSMLEGCTIELEHSLFAISKWESIHQKPFLVDAERTDAEMFSYVECMIISPNYPSDVIERLTMDHLEQISAYMESSQTATWFNDPVQAKQTRDRTVVTSELMYYWMIECHVPFECDRWNLNRLQSLLRICAIKNNGEQKMSAAERNAYNRNLNAQRRQQYNTKG